VSGRLRLVSLCGALVTVLLQSPSAAVAAPNWDIGLGPTSGGETPADGAPAAPAGVTATCASPTGNIAEIDWNAVGEATTYTIYDSTTSSTGGFTAAATGVVGTSWTSSGLGSGDYWFEVAASVGTYWAGPDSSATAQLTITATECT
jgi:hypothetical protein